MVDRRMKERKSEMQCHTLLYVRATDGGYEHKAKDYAKGKPANFLS